MLCNYDCNLQVAKGDRLPNNICGECSCKLDLLNAFRDKAHKTAAELLSKIDDITLKEEVN